jgi:hypothetical protein
MSFHSIDDGICGLAITARCATSASHTTAINSNSETKAIIDPIVDTMFHVVIASG